MQALNFREFVFADGGTLTTTSMHVAAAFGKQHEDVLKAIKKISGDVHALKDSKNHAGYFAEMVVEAQIGSGAMRPSRSYRITRDGFSLLAMGFTGKKALAFKLAYIDAFNAMADYIKNQHEGLSYRRVRHELECKDSARRGSFHGRGLNERKQELSVLSAEEGLLMAISQPGLFLPGSVSAQVSAEVSKA